jgi:hypothetical protein
MLTRRIASSGFPLGLPAPGRFPPFVIDLDITLFL